MGKKSKARLMQPELGDILERVVFDFSEAVIYAKKGKLLARESWQGAWIFVGRVGFIHTPPNFPVAAVETAPCFFYYDGKGVFHAGWSPTFEDIRAEDWVEVTSAQLG